MTTLTPINLETASIAELKAYCSENEIIVVGDKRKRQSYLDSIDANKEVEKLGIDFDLVALCYADDLQDHHDRKNEQLIAVDYYVGQTLEDLHSQTIDEIVYRDTTKTAHISNTVIKYAIEIYFSVLTQADFDRCTKYIDKEDYDDAFPTTFYFVLSWDLAALQSN